MISSTSPPLLLPSGTGRVGSGLSGLLRGPWFAPDVSLGTVATYVEVQFWDTSCGCASEYALTAAVLAMPRYGMSGLPQCLLLRAAS